jgi:hypothetical protein
MSRGDIGDYLTRLDNDVKRLKLELYRICWYMRGGIDINDLLYNLGQEDRNIMYDIIKDNIELTKVSRMPLM